MSVKTINLPTLTPSSAGYTSSFVLQDLLHSTVNWVVVVFAVVRIAFASQVMVVAELAIHDTIVEAIKFG